MKNEILKSIEHSDADEVNTSIKNEIEKRVSQNSMLSFLNIQVIDYLPNQPPDTMK